jgi:hypothetical protein
MKEGKMDFIRRRHSLMVMMILAAGFVIAGTVVQCKKGPEGNAAVEGPKAGEPPAPAGQPSGAAPVSSRSVVINGQRLSDQTVEALEATFRIKVMDGQYWYDRMNGSWGIQGGPAAGFIMAGLDLGGPLRADASSGDTGVFINGRQLHRVDVARLSQLGPVFPGRCWMDAFGNIGLEGQPAFGNIWVAVRALGGGGGQKEGILSTYDKTGMAVIGY